MTRWSEPPLSVSRRKLCNVRLEQLHITALLRLKWTLGYKQNSNILSDTRRRGTRPRALGPGSVTVLLSKVQEPNEETSMFFRNFESPEHNLVADNALATFRWRFLFTRLTSKRRVQRREKIGKTKWPVGWGLRVEIDDCPTTDCNVKKKSAEADRIRVTWVTSKWTPDVEHGNDIETGKSDSRKENKKNSTSHNDDSNNKISVGGEDKNRWWDKGEKFKRQ